MISLEQLESYYPPNLRHFKKNILREYLQYKILDIVFNSNFNISGKLSFMEGAYNNYRRIFYSITLKGTLSCCCNIKSPPNPCKLRLGKQRDILAMNRRGNKEKIVSDWMQKIKLNLKNYIDISMKVYLRLFYKYFSLFQNIQGRKLSL